MIDTASLVESKFLKRKGDSSIQTRYWLIIAMLAAHDLYAWWTSDLLTSALGLQRLHAFIFLTCAALVLWHAVRKRYIFRVLENIEYAIAVVLMGMWIILGILNFDVQTTLWNDCMYYGAILLFAVGAPMSERDIEKTIKIVIGAGLLFSVLALRDAYEFAQAGYERRFFAVGSVGKLAPTVTYAGYILAFIGAAGRPLVYCAGTVMVGASIGIAMFGQFRGGVLVGTLVLVLSGILFLKNKTVSQQARLAVVGGILIAVVGGFLLVGTQATSAFQTMSDRLDSLERSQAGSSLLVSLTNDARFHEVPYMFENTPLISLLVGSGMGSSYYDAEGFFSDESPNRAVIHVNWAHWLFKIGIVGYIVFYRIYKFRSYPWLHIEPETKARFYTFLAILAIDATYYGMKEFGLALMIVTLAVINPALWAAGQKSRR